MQTPWGDIVVEDAHAHFFSRSFFEGLNRQRPQPSDDVDRMVAELGWEPPPADNAELARRWAAELDRHGVARSVLMASLPGDEAAAAAAVRALPDRFYGYFMLNPLAPDAVERCRRAFDSGLKGLCLFPAMLRFSVRDERLKPLYELAAERPGTTVFVHMGALSVGVRKKLGLPSKFDVTYSNPLELHAVASEFPGVPFVMPHFGAGFFREALLVGDLASNVYLDTSSTNAWVRYQWPEMTLADVFGRALEVYGPERLLFGSDSSFFPRGWVRAVFDVQVRALEEVGLGADAAAAILGGNLRRLMGG